MAKRKFWKVPEKHRSPNWKECVFLGEVDTKGATFAISSVGKHYSEAELRLLAAELEVRKETFADQCDKAIRVIEEMLAEERIANAPGSDPGDDPDNVGA